MSLFNYVDPPNANLICCICRAPFTDPTTTRTCAHTFCAECILRALSHASACPIDRTPLTPADLAPADPIVRSLVDEMRVECVHSAAGCAHVGQRQDMALHLREECVYAEGRSRPEPVTEGDAEVDEAETADTDDEVGPAAPHAPLLTAAQTACPHAAFGCAYTGPVAAHLPACPYEALKGFLALHAAKTGLLAEQNVVLRHRVDTLEHTVATLRREMGATKTALGPWFRAASLPPGVAAAPSRPPPVDALAAYFPAEERRLDVAALEVGPSLEGTLAGLRESVVGLAAGVESVGRRGEIALTNETLRLGEEMMSVRAQMQGLRMQVHGLMMERNAAHEAARMGQMQMGSATKL
ncbi:hypothetical protein HYPSUDRAFT_130585 [Hypholoma sublateritium FD-334 SS-4]|uniref:RING-type domain-containing protein n=1 Tax=Hypholoma sublateritium (strain FD-334 SS-4) TaxID=945553 RepID=A0A0D2MV70_HYPSF|nr:hypothetical protein HYPSUDRAFT_130585 [Hypholoma sublateritium FD-334 SS-4]